MSTKKLLVVFGVTGNQGGSVVNSILNDPSISEQFKIRIITRGPTKPSAVAIVEHRIPPLKADLDDKDSLRAALKDAHTVFTVTKLQEVLNKEREVQQGKKIADVTKKLDIQHLIWSGLPNVTKIIKGKITGVLHFDSKAIIEDYIRSLSIPSTFLHLAVFMEQLPFMFIPTSAGAKTYKLITPISSSIKFPLIPVQADACKYVKSIILHRELFGGKVIKGGVKEYTLQEVADALVKVGGLDVVTAQCADEVYRGMLMAFGLSGFVVDGMAENIEVLSEKLETLDGWIIKSPQIAAMK